MDDRFAPRLQAMLDDAVCGPEVTEGLLEQLGDFLGPYVESLTEPAQRTHVGEYVRGLFSKLKHKTGEAIAYLHDCGRQGLQKFIGIAPWDHAPLLKTLAKEVGEQIGEVDGVIVFDPSAFAKKGKKSVGVARQWSGRQGKVDNCQVGVFMGYVSRLEHALVDFRLYLPKEWTDDKTRCAEAGVPTGTKFRTRHELALEMLDEKGKLLPHAWVTGDDEMGRPAEFRGNLRSRGERYLLAVPSNTLVRDLETEPPAGSGGGRPRARPHLQMRRWREALPASAWTSIDVRDGEKGPLTVEAAWCRVTAKLGTTEGPEERMFVIREPEGDGSYHHDYYLAHVGATDASLTELARVSKAEHRIEECLRRGKTETGMGDYQVRNWVGWHRHLTLSLVAAWFLVGAMRQKKNRDPRAHGSAAARPDRQPAGGVARLQPPGQRPTSREPLAGPNRTGEVLSLPKA